MDCCLNIQNKMSKRVEPKVVLDTTDVYLFSTRLAF